MKLVFNIVLTICILFISVIYNQVKAYYYNEYKQYDKVIRINTYSEKLSYYEKGEKIGVFDISSGDKDNYTPAGRFRIMNKEPMMWSKTAQKWMPNWLEFYNGEYGIHGLALDSKYEQISTEEESIGLEAGGGCVRVGKQDINELYDWADYGTVVLIAYDLVEYEGVSEGEQVVKDYFSYINERKYQEAYNLKRYKKYSLNRFNIIYSDLQIKNIQIEKLESSKYLSKVDIYRDGQILAGGIKSVFFVGGGQIVNSYVLK